MVTNLRRYQKMKYKDILSLKQVAKQTKNTVMENCSTFWPTKTLCLGWSQVSKKCCSRKRARRSHRLTMNSAPRTRRPTRSSTRRDNTSATARTSKTLTRKLISWTGSLKLLWRKMMTMMMNEIYLYPCLLLKLSQG